MSYPKLNSQDKCAFPERKDCNYIDDGKIPRCPYMKYNNSKSIFDPTRWECRYKDKQTTELNKVKNIKEV
jgi:hypothetical protein